MLPLIQEAGQVFPMIQEARKVFPMIQEARKEFSTTQEAGQEFPTTQKVEVGFPVLPVCLTRIFSMLSRAPSCPMMEVSRYPRERRRD